MDVTERKRAEQERERVEMAMRASEAHWCAVFKVSSVGIATSETGGRVLSANPAFERIVGYSRADLQALQWRERMFADKPKDHQVHSELAAVNYMIGEFKLKTGNLAEARKRLERSRELRAALVEGDGRNAVWKRDLAISLYRLGSLCDREKNEKAALEAFEASRTLSQQLVDDDPHNDKRLMELMKVLSHTGQIEKAVGIADRFSAGGLVKLFDAELTTNESYYLLHRPEDRAREDLQELTRWILSECRVA